ncbi:MAG: copper resistance protein CopC [Micrococcales bacterium]|nr:copper resistance protein CopC [Micrococcales bacterium]
MRQLIIRVGLILLALAVIMSLVLSGASLASAHAQLLSVSPADKATVTQPPDKVELTFNEEINPSFVVVRVSGADGTSVTSGDPSVTGGVVSQPISSGAPGQHTITYRVVSKDGHPIAGRTTFTAMAGGTGAQTPSATTGSQSPSTSSPASEPTTTPSSSGAGSATAAATPASPTSPSGVSGQPLDERVPFWDKSHIPGFVAVAGFLVIGVLIAVRQAQKRA